MRHSKKTISIAAVTAVLAISVLLFTTIGKDAISDREGNANTLTMLETLNEVISRAEGVYYKEIDRKKMYEGAIKGALAALDDPYCFYLTAEHQQRERENLYNAKFGGLGIRIYEDKGFVKIARPLPNTPAMKAGLQSGDYIIKVEGDAISIGGPSGQTLNDVVDTLRGEVGEPVTVTIQRRGNDKPFDITLIRAEIKIDSVETTVIDEAIGYIRINSFTGRTSDEFSAVLNKFFSSKSKIMIKSLILDLRDNPGGLLSAAQIVSDAFVSEGLIVSTQGKSKEFDREYPATPTMICPPDVELIVLVNEYSASGSEIVAGAIKDNDRGLLIGTTTFGKGVVQQRFPLKYGGAVSLTISTYYTPNGTTIHEKGVEPHVEIDPKRLTMAEAEVRAKMRKGRYIADFIEKWIEKEEKRIGETPKDFSQISQKIPELMKTLKENEIDLDENLVKIDAQRIFNSNVGIYQLIDREHDNRLQKAIEILQSGEFQKVLSESIETKEL